MKHDKLPPFCREEDHGAGQARRIFAPRSERRGAAAGGAPEQGARRASDAPLREGNRLELLKNGPCAYDDWVEAIGKATRWVQIEKVKRFFRDNMIVPDCPYCAGHGWGTGEMVRAEIVDERGNALPEGTSVAMVQVVCDNCGHVTFFDAGRLGLIKG